MTRTRCFHLATVALIVTVCFSGQLALSQSHFEVRAVPHQAQTTPDSNPAPTANLYGLSATFAGTPFALGPNTDGSDRWPCFGSNSTNTDCPTIGNPSITFPTGGAALGVPQYVWSYTACDANSSSVPPCGQTNTFYEDDSNDSTDDLIYLLTATQVQSGKVVYVADSGTVDFAGANPFGGAAPPADVVIYGDQNFGTLGATGKNNGNCSANFNYPVTYPTITYPYVVAANKTCVNPVPGLVTITALTELAHPTYTQHGSTATVKFTIIKKLQQKWTIWLQ